MFLVGHAVVAFLIAYILCRIFRVNQGVSFALAMVIGIIPDIDIITQSLGIMAHKTFTHSLIVSPVIVGSIFLVTKVGFKQTFAVAMIYSLAYVQHIMDDVVIGTLNVLYPIGNLPLSIGIAYGSLTHEIIEILLLVVAASIIVGKSFGSIISNSTDDGMATSSLFRFSITDKISYTILIASLLFSFGYLLYEMESLPRLILETNIEIALFVLLHLAALTWVSFMMLAARQDSAISKRSLISDKQ
ncbi:MAG TPA: metal-dependent hydrolase [Nitrososphaeraceae archaeon]|nr:metal-dependent hydrolase [Nitrososphaeraceae archaeon]